jgi:hypothetical protein
MFRRLSAIGIVLAIWTFGSVDIDACGDKFLRVGRSGRQHRYAAVHRASVLIVYRSANWTPKGVGEFEALLNQAGHTARAVEYTAGWSKAIAAAKYDVIIAAYGDAVEIRDALRPLQSKPGLLPILYKPAKNVAAAAKKEYAHLITDKTDKAGALEQIDHVIDLALKAAATGA